MELLIRGRFKAPTPLEEAFARGKRQKLRRETLRAETPPQDNWEDDDLLMRVTSGSAENTDWGDRMRAPDLGPEARAALLTIGSRKPLSPTNSRFQTSWSKYNPTETRDGRLFARPRWIAEVLLREPGRVDYASLMCRYLKVTSLGGNNRHFDVEEFRLKFKKKRARRTHGKASPTIKDDCETGEAVPSSSR